MFDRSVYFANGDLPPEDAKTLVLADEPRYRLPASLQGRNRLPAIMARLPISEGAISLLGATIGLLLARIIHLRRVGQVRVDRWWVRTSRNRADLWPPAWEDADNSDR